MATCTTCHNEIPAGSEVLVSARRGSALALCPDCANAVEQVFQAEMAEPNHLQALALGLAAGLVAALVWYGVVVRTNYQLGIVAIAVGWLAGQAVLRGAGGKRGATLQWLSVAITFLAMASSEYLIMRHFVARIVAEQGGSLPLLLPPGLAIEMIVGALRAEPITLLFWAFALYQAFVIPAPRRLRRLATA